MELLSKLEHSGHSSFLFNKWYGYDTNSPCIGQVNTTFVEELIYLVLL